MPDKTSYLAVGTPPSVTRANTPIDSAEDEAGPIGIHANADIDPRETAQAWASPSSPMGMGTAAAFDSYTS